MLLPAPVARGVRDGTVTLAFRRWEQPRVRVGGTQLTSAGIVRFEAVTEVFSPADVSDADARAAGFPDAEALRRRLWPEATPRPEDHSGECANRTASPLSADRSGELANPDASPPSPPPSRGPRASKGGDHVYRVRLSWAGDDPRTALREAIPGATELAELASSVARLDASRRAGPWTRPVLEWIRDHPGVISTELAALLGREVLPLKADIRRLKALGLTESLRVGYRLSARGRAYLESLG